MNQLDPALLARGVETLAGAPKGSIKLFLLLLGHDVGLADAIDIVHEYGKDTEEEEEDKWGLGPSVTQRNKPAKPGRPRKANSTQET